MEAAGPGSNRKEMAPTLPMMGGIGKQGMMQVRGSSDFNNLAISGLKLKSKPPVVNNRRYRVRVNLNT